MKDYMDNLLKTALAPMDAPEKRLNDQILRKVEEKQNMAYRHTHYRSRIPAAVLAALCVLILCSGTAFAVYKYLSPADVAKETENDKLQKAFQSDDAILVNETQESGGYQITLLGSVAGKNISSFLSYDGQGEVEDDKIYTVVAIERADGTPMPDTSSDEYGEEEFYASHYIRGLNPSTYSLMSMGGGYSALVRDGIQYRILEMDNIEMFADKGIYVGVSSGTFYDMDAYVYNETTGEISRNVSYPGVNALFELPVDKNKADPAAAAAYLEEFEKSRNEPSEPLEQDETDLSVDAFMDHLNPENIDEFAEPIESTRQICQVDQDGIVHSAYELENGASGKLSGSFDELFPDGNPGMCRSFSCSYSEDGLDSLLIDVYILNEDGTVTFVVYQPKKNKD